MAPKTLYDAAEMQAKANQTAEKELRILAREGAELPRSAEVTCEYLGVLKDDRFTFEAKPTLRSTVGYKWSYRDNAVDVRKRPATTTPRNTVPACQSNGRQP